MVHQQKKIKFWFVPFLDCFVFARNDVSLCTLCLSPFGGIEGRGDFVVKNLLILNFQFFTLIPIFIIGQLPTDFFQ